jgi:hypothetical protein
MRRESRKYKTYLLRVLNSAPAICVVHDTFACFSQLGLRVAECNNPNKLTCWGGGGGSWLDALAALSVSPETSREEPAAQSAECLPSAVEAGNRFQGVEVMYPRSACSARRRAAERKERNSETG